MSPDSSANTASLYSLRTIHPSLLSQATSLTVTALPEEFAGGRVARALTIGWRVDGGEGSVCACA